MVDKTPAELDPGTASDTSVVHASENDVSTNSRKHTERDISRLQGTAPLYSSSKTYIVNDLVTESGLLFRCINSIAVPEPFNAANWIEVNSENSIISVRNISGSMISKGSAVYVTGEDSGIATVELALASGVSTVPSIGLAQANIANNNNGNVLNIGNLTNLDTSTFLAGDILFLSATVPGALTATAPTHPDLRQSLGVVLVSDISIGEIEAITGDISGAESGTIFNTFAIGNGLAGTKTLSFVNAAGTFTADSSHTTSRNQNFQDDDGIIALTSDIIDTTAANVGSGTGLIFRDKTGITLNLKTLLAGTGIAVTNNADDITLSVTAGDTKSGSGTVALGGTTTVSFNTAFSTAPNVVVSFATDVNYTTAEKGVALSVYNITVNGFTVRYDEPDGTGIDPASFEWMATNAGNP